MKRNFFSSHKLNSRIHSENIQKKEQILGYFLGPCLVSVMYMGVAGNYLTQFYTDVLGLTGVILTMMPFISKILSSLINLFIGHLIDSTKTNQGKARPWILVSGVFIAVCGILMYAVPNASYEIKIVWIVISYNLFFSLAYSTYSLSHSLMLPLSTRDSKKRDTLAMLTSTGTSIIPGMLATIIMPLLISKIGVGSAAKNSWLTIMSILSLIAVPATIIEYYFTRERVTDTTDSHKMAVPFKRQLIACIKDKYWVAIILFTLIISFCNGLSTSSMLYYCNWVLGNSIESGAGKQILINMIGQAPLGFGIIILWPLVRKFGKRKITIIGFSISAIGSLTVLFAGTRINLVLGGLLVKSIGALPIYVITAFLAEAIDHIESQYGFRTDVITASVNNIIQTLVGGLAQTLILAGISLFGYIAPNSTAHSISQPHAMQTFFRWCFVGIPMIGYVLGTLIMMFHDIESNQNITREHNKNKNSKRF